ncbi:MAG: glycosyltransferase family 39 protein [bacterium]|nr:glycosyltransferase family 39 protein [bacterium]
MKKWLRENIILVFIVLLGAFLRFYNLNWDDGHFFHPDERNIANAVSRIRFFTQLNPDFFAYGSLPIYLYRAVGEVFVFLTKNPKWVSEWESVNLIGRGASAFFSTSTIFLIYLLGKKLWQKEVGILAALLAALTVSLIQAAHFDVTESMLTFWLTLITILSLIIAKKPLFNMYVKTGVVIGLAVATKIAAVSFVPIFLLAHFIPYFRKIKLYPYLVLALTLSIFIFTIVSPYVFLDYTKFFESMNYETGVASGRSKVVYVLQFEKTTPYLFQLKNLIWQMGPVALVGLAGILVLTYLFIKKKDKKLFIFLIFPFLYFGYFGSWYTKFIRYMVPLIPFLCLSAAWLMIKMERKWERVGFIFNMLILAITVLWSLAFFSIYTREQTRITASKWIYQNIPAESKILTEHWDDGLPVDLPPYFPSRYKTEALTIYEPDNKEKINYYADKLSSGDFMVINSRRLYGTLINLPEKYPITSRYYQLLFSGRLGYVPITQFTSYPQLFGIQINDDASEETFQVYEHPKVIVFKNQSRLSASLIRQILALP